MNALLHSGGAHIDVVSEFLHDIFGNAAPFIEEVFVHSFLETLTLIPFLFLTYLLMEFIEHNASDKTRTAMARAGVFGPLFSALGALPQCGFSAAAANLYTARVITLGTLVGVFLSTSDEMLPILIAGEVDILNIVLIVAYKIVTAIIAGFAIDFVIRLIGAPKREIDIDVICDESGCNCQDGVFKSAINHTVSVALSCFVVILALNCVLFFAHEEFVSSIIVDIPVLSHLICAVIGLVPNCAASVVLAELAVGGFISVGEMLAGLFSAAGVGLFVLFRMNKSIKENLVVVGLLLLFGVVFGFVADLLPFIAI